MRLQMCVWAMVISAATMAFAAQPATPADVIPRLPAADHKDFCIYTSALSPFVVIRNNGPRTLLFQGLSPSGPASVALVDDHKVRIFPTSQAIDPKDMSECWMLFFGLKTQPQVDAPILVVLQKLPSAIKPAAGGIELTFPSESGHIAIVPLYGSKPIPAADTAAWSAGLPDAVAARCRSLAEISREYPIEVQEKYKLLLPQDKVLIRDRYEFLSIDDEWKTGHKKIAPLEPTVARAWKDKFRLLSISGTVVDLGMPTRYGAFAGVEGDECTYTLTALLRYINQAETSAKSETAEQLKAGWPSRLKTFATAPKGWGSIEGNLAETIALARAGWRVGDEDAYRFACYLATKQFVTVWTMGKSISPEKLSPPELRFARERMGLAAGAAGEKYVPLWKTASEAPGADAVFRMGLSGTTGAAAHSPVLDVRTSDSAWPVLMLPVSGSDTISLGQVSPGTAPVRPERAGGFSLTTWAADIPK